MARKPSLSIETLSALGIEKLAQMVLDESGRNAAFRKLVNAALAGTKGPDAIAKLIDRRLGALERASSFIDWEKTRAFRDDLRATVLTISGELGSASPAMAIDRLLRFIATEDSVMERVDDSSGRIDSVYRDAIGALGELAPKLKPDEADLLPERIMTALGEIVDGYLIDVANAVMKHLSEPALLRWDRTLAELQRKAEETDKNRKERYYLSNAPHYRSMRQAIADDRGDIDGSGTAGPPREDILAMRALQTGRRMRPISNGCVSKQRS